MTLLEILESNPEWNTIDCLEGTDKNTSHDYINGFYDKEFAKYQDKKVSLLEIGYAGGGSLALWSKYFTNADILGIDIADTMNECFRSVGGFQSIVMDAYTKETADSLKDFDIIIDDGPHTLESMKQCIHLYLSKVKKNGILVIEDVQDSSWFEELKECTPIEYRDNIECLDLRANKGRSDDLMFIIRK